ncbi:FecR family protein [Halalkalibaculum sp. DA384]|uniref:FecR family protein n=1 Tax=Halalkalibaculum sp. DA384 TaxID=3373606 RepID=UPI003754C43C
MGKSVTEFEQELMDLLDDPSFSRWIKGEASPEEQKKWEKWEAEDPVHRDYRKRAQALFQLPFEEQRGDDLQKELTRFQSRLNDYPHIFNKKEKLVHSPSGYRWAVAAAVILLVVTVSVLTLYNRQEPTPAEPTPLFSTIEVGYGEKGALKISDGSTIKLNANSTLRYSPEQFNSSNVEVWLEGEAYFSIVRDPEGKKRNFTVHTPDGDVRILGTRFNVNTRYDRTGVVLEEGSLEVLLKDSANGVAGQFKLKPGQRAQFSVNQPNVQIQEVDTLLYTAWIDGKFVFREIPFNELVRDVEHIYGITIQIEDASLLNQKVTGTLRNPDLQTLMEGISTILHVDVVQEKEGFYSIIKRDK